MRLAPRTCEVFRLRTAAVSLGIAFALLGPQTHAAGKAGLDLRYSAEPQPVTVSISGIVRDKRTGNPVPGATVRAHLNLGRNQGPDHFEKSPSQQTTTDPQGQYRITFVTPLTTSGAMQGKDSFCVDAGAPGYQTLPQYGREKVTSRNCVFTNLNFDLTPGKPVRGVVVDAAGRPASGVVIRVQNSLNGDWNFFGSLGQTATGEDGSFQVWPGASGESTPWLCLQKPGAGFLFVWDILAKEDLGTLTLSSGSVLAGRVVGANGTPAAGCEVSVRGFPCFLIGSTVADAEGKYELRGVPGESSLKAFYQRKNKRYIPDWGKLEVHARLSPEMNLKDAPHYQIALTDGQTGTAPDLVVGSEAAVSGLLLPSKTALGLGGLLVRLDDRWENMVETQLGGRFQFAFVSPGKHTLTAYLPHNLRYDRGIGKAQIEVQAGTALKDVQIRLEDLAEQRVQYLDAKGNPLAGITAGATWSKNDYGAWTEGTVSDEEGWAVIYLYPDSAQYVQGFDRTRKLTAETIKEVKPQPGQVMGNLQVVMVPTASLAGRLFDVQGQRLANKQLRGTLALADGTASYHPIQTGADGRFRLEGIRPGIMKFMVEMDDMVFRDPLGKAVEVRPGATEELGDIVLKDGLDRKKIVREKLAQAVSQPAEVSQAAREFFEKIRSADYDSFLKPGADWHQFPIVGSYQTRQWFDVLVGWMSRTFKTNPIVRVELGQVFANPQEFDGHKGLPTVPYKLMLKDGAVLAGNLPFTYEFEGTTGHWFGLHGIDWHLQKLTR